MTPEEEGPDALTSGASEHPCVSKEPGDGRGPGTLGTTHRDDELIRRGTHQCRQVSELRTTEPLPQWKPVCPTGAHSTAGSVTSLVPSLPLCSSLGHRRNVKLSQPLAQLMTQKLPVPGHDIRAGCLPGQPLPRCPHLEMGPQKVVLAPLPQRASAS